MTVKPDFIKGICQRETRYANIDNSGEAALGNLTTTSFQKVANNVAGMTLPITGHLIPEERPNFLTKQILVFQINLFLSCRFC